MTLTKRECLALCLHLVPRNVDTLAKAKTRRTLFAALGLVELSQDIADVLRAGQGTVGKDWIGRTETGATAELGAEHRAYLLDALQPPWVGQDSEVLMDIRDKVEPSP